MDGEAMASSSSSADLLSDASFPAQRPQTEITRKPRRNSNDPVDHEEIQTMREWLRERGWIEADDFFSDEYLHEVIHGVKDGKQRTFEYSSLKLQQSLQWRRDYGAAHISRLDVSNALAPGHMWWEGEDLFGRPILYARPGEMDLSTYCRDEYVRAHVWLIEQGLQRMRPGVSSFVLVVDASNLGVKHFDLVRDKLLLHIGCPCCYIFGRTHYSVSQCCSSAAVL